MTNVCPVCGKPRELVDPESTRIDRVIHCAGTGHELSEEILRAEYLGTVQDPPFVWHYFVER